MPFKYTIVIKDKDLYESQKKGWEIIEESVAYQRLTDRTQEIVKSCLREYSKLLHGIMWKNSHVAFTDGAVLAALLGNYTEIPTPELKMAAIKLLARCPDDSTPVAPKEEPTNTVPSKQSHEAFRENYIRIFGKEP